MIGLLIKLLYKLPVLSRRRNPVWALVIGFLTGGVGLGIYLRSIVDCVGVIIAMVVLVGFYHSVYHVVEVNGLGFLFGGVVAAAYGYLRVRNSNARREAKEQARLAH